MKATSRFGNLYTLLVMPLWIQKGAFVMLCYAQLERKRELFWFDMQATVFCFFKIHVNVHKYSVLFHRWMPGKRTFFCPPQLVNNSSKRNGQASISSLFGRMSNVPGVSEDMSTSSIRSYPIYYHYHHYDCHKDNNSILSFTIGPLGFSW